MKAAFPMVPTPPGGGIMLGLAIPGGPGGGPGGHGGGPGGPGAAGDANLPTSVKTVLTQLQTDTKAGDRQPAEDSFGRERLRNSRPTWPRSRRAPCGYRRHDRDPERQDAILASQGRDRRADHHQLRPDGGPGCFQDRLPERPGDSHRHRRRRIWVQPRWSESLLKHPLSRSSDFPATSRMNLHPGRVCFSLAPFSNLIS